MTIQNLISSGINLYKTSINRITNLSDSVPQLFLRLLLAWEFFESGLEKLHGTNWFSDLTFPFPFNILPPDTSWRISIFFEIVGAFALALGFATRVFSISLIILTLVAISAVHWPEHWNSLSDLVKGYRIIDQDGDGYGNYKLPVIYLVMFLPLLFGGAGKVSIDHLIKSKVNLINSNDGSQLKL